MKTEWRVMPCPFCREQGHVEGQPCFCGGRGKVLAKYKNIKYRTKKPKEKEF